MELLRLAQGEDAGLALTARQELLTRPRFERDRFVLWVLNDTLERLARGEDTPASTSRAIIDELLQAETAARRDSETALARVRELEQQLEPTNDVTGSFRTNTALTYGLDNLYLNKSKRVLNRNIILLILSCAVLITWAGLYLFNEKLAGQTVKTSMIQPNPDQLSKQLAAKDAQIAELDRMLNEAMEATVEELSHYRSEFFGRLREVLGERPDIRIVGDRFVFQSDWLFPSASATLDPDSKAALRQVAQTLRDVAAKIPRDINWMLQVAGHTDRRPIRTGSFASNWELSTARANSIVQFLINEGIPPERLAAAGFAEFHPLDLRNDEVAYMRNRRIEFKLTKD
jgi:chemotaxis protein MotB